jgi:hypothetical protein
MPTGDGGAPSTAPPPPGGAVPSGGDASPGAETSGMAPPTGAPGAIDGNVPPQGLSALGMEIMRKVMAGIHLGRSLLDPYSEEGKAADTMFRHGAKHFKPDHDSVKGSQMPALNQVGAGGGAPGGAPPPMAPPGGGGPGPLPQPPTGPMPALAGAGA